MQPARAHGDGFDPEGILGRSRRPTPKALGTNLRAYALESTSSIINSSGEQQWLIN
jgi:hypothetical protein